MTEAEWLACSTPELMMTFLAHHRVEDGYVLYLPEASDCPGDRKRRLFACACCRHIWHLISAKRGQPVVAVVERFADGLADDTERANAFRLAMEGRRMAPMSSAWSDAMHAVAETASRSTVDWRTVHQAVHAADTREQWDPSAPAMNLKHAELLRHIVGNPFRPYPAPPHWPAAVTDLAAALYNGSDCTFALHDALLEAGHAELAEHFREREHPKGCWAMDVILGKA